MTRTKKRNLILAAFFIVSLISFLTINKIDAEMTKDPSHFKIETTTTEKVAVKYQSMAKVFTALANFVHNTVS